MFGKRPSISSSKAKQQRFNAKINQYKIESVLGQGTYGKVKLCTHIATNEQVAIKFIEKNRLIRVNDTERVQIEMSIITELNHPNILKAFEIFEDDTYFYIVMERPSKGDLFNYICKKKRLSLSEATNIFYQIVNSIDFIHRNKIVHRDMKPENIMLTEDMIVKLGDFGLSRHYKSANIKLETTCGSPCYSAPEMLKGNRYYPKPIDIWGLGIMLYVMICGELPFDGDSEDVLYRKVVQCEYKFPHYCNNNVKDLIRKIFVANPAERITMEEIKRHPVYLTGKANFIKDIKIYADDGDVLPIVKEYLKQKTFKSLQEECSMEINAKTQELTAYKIFFHKYLHKTPWKDYYIPSRLEAVKIEETPIDKKSTLKGKKKHNSVEHSNDTFIDSLLQIPEHDLLGSSFAMTNAIPKVKNDNRELIEGVSKLGVVTHSFDRNKLNNEDTFCETDRKKKNRSSSAEQTGCYSMNVTNGNNTFAHTINDHNNTTMNNAFMNSIKNYTKDDYIRDVKMLARQKYLPSGRRIPFKV